MCLGVCVLVWLGRCVRGCVQCRACVRFLCVCVRVDKRICNEVELHWEKKDAAEKRMYFDFGYGFTFGIEGEREGCHVHAISFLFMSKYRVNPATVFFRET